MIHDGRETAPFDDLHRLLRVMTPMNRTVVSDDMDRAADLLDAAMEMRAVRHRYPSGAEYGSWIVPPSWNVREAFQSNGTNVIASYRDHVLFLAPHSAPFEGWIPRSELLSHVFSVRPGVDAFSYQHRIAYDPHRRLQQWEISLPARIVDRLMSDRYYVKIDVDVRPGHMNVLEYVLPGSSPRSIGVVAHLRHPGQANDGLSGVVAAVGFFRRIRSRARQSSYRLLILPETIGSAVHMVAQDLGPDDLWCAIFLETMGGGERLWRKHTRSGDRPIDLAARSIAREHPHVGLLQFHEGYGNDDHVLDFPNVRIPTAGIQYHPSEGYHSSDDSADRIDPTALRASVDLLDELCRRLELDRRIKLRYPGPPYLSRYRLYADAVTQRERQNAQLLELCDGEHTVLEMCDRTGLTFDEVTSFFGALERAGLLAEDGHGDRG